MDIKDLEVYRLANEISNEAWIIYDKLDWRDKKTMGYQFISAIDSVGANIAEGFGRYHYLDRNKFNYNARGSLFESLYWLETTKRRDKITEIQFSLLEKKLINLSVKLNNYISSTKKEKLRSKD